MLKVVRIHIVALVVGLSFASAAIGQDGAGGGKGFDDAKPLPELFVFGKSLSPDNSGGYGAAQEYFRDPFLGDLAPVPRELRNSAAGAAGTPAKTKAKSTSVIDPDTVTRAGPNDPSAAPAGVANSESAAGAEPNAFSMGVIRGPNNPVDKIIPATNIGLINERVTKSSGQSTALYVLRGADPNYGQALVDAAQFGLNFSQNVTLAAMQNHALNKEAGAQGEFRNMGTEICQNFKLKEGRKSKNEATYPEFACQADIAGLAFDSDKSGAQPASAALQTREGSSPFVASSTVNTRVGAGPGLWYGMQIAAARAKAAAYAMCGLPEQNNPDLPRDATCLPPVIDEMKGQNPGATSLGGFTLSYLMFPNPPGGEQKVMETQSQRRAEFRSKFGDMCFACFAGGKDSNNQELDLSVGRLLSKKIDPVIPLYKTYQEVEKSIYENLRRILYHKCYADNADRSSEGPTDEQAVDIFNLKSGADPYSGEQEEKWNDGNFWRGDAALGTNAQNKLPGDINVYQALDFMSFNGFRLTPPTIDAMYHVLTEKESIAAMSENQGAGGADFLNRECDRRLRDEMSYDQVIQRLRPFAMGATRGGIRVTKTTPLPREIKVLYFFAQRLALGKIFDGCEQALMRVDAVPSVPLLSTEATNLVLNVCSGETNDPEAFGRKRGENIGMLNNFVDKMFQQIAGESGKSGSSIAQTFRGNKELAAKGNLQ